MIKPSTSVMTRWTATLFGLAMLACTPELNWREVQLGPITVLLPCKPDHAQRIVRIAAADAPMQMVGCKTAEAQYAVSRVHVMDPAQITAIQSAWYAATVANLKTSTVQSRAVKIPRSLTGVRLANRIGNQRISSDEFELLIAKGLGPDGSSLEAQFIWFVHGLDIYLVAVYGVKLDRDQTELLFSELRMN